ncbi:MAG: hypothetical protein WKG01_13975 [Kofleriaceae bacterium]
MPLHAEDVYEDLDEADDEDIEDALGEDDYSERRRRRGRGGRGRAKGGGYNKPRIEKSFATQAQLQQVSERIAADVRALDANVKSLEVTARRGQGNMNQSMQMMMLLPMLSKKTIKASELQNKGDTKVVIDDGDVMTMMLPMMMMMGAGNSGTATNGQNGGMDPMMMMMMVMIMTDSSRKASA